MREPRFSFEVLTALAPDEAWRRVVDVSSHGDVVPLTVGRGPAPQEARVGSRFVARTAVGPVGFDDVMEVREIAPGRRVVFEKVGRVIGGTIVVDVMPEGGGSRVEWRQSITLPWVPLALRPAAVTVTSFVAPVVGRGYVTVVRKLLDPRR